MTYKELFSTDAEDIEINEIKKCLQSLTEIAYKAITKNERKITVDFKFSDGDLVSFEGVEINCKVCKELDLFFIKREDKFTLSIEARHFIIMEFFAACSFACNTDFRKDLLAIQDNWKRAIFPLVAGLLNADNFTTDFMTCVMDFQRFDSSHLHHFYSWLFSVEHTKWPADVYHSTKGKWCGFTKGCAATPPFQLLVSMTKESTRPPLTELLPTSLVFYSTQSTDLVKYFIGMYDLIDLFDLHHSAMTTIESYLSTFPSNKIKMDGYIHIEDSNALSPLCRLKNIDQFTMNLKGLFIASDAKDLNVLKILDATENLHVDGKSEIFCDIMDSVANKFANGGPLGLLINNIHIVHIDKFHHFVKAALVAESIEVLNKLFSNEQWTQLEDAIRKRNCNIKSLKFSYLILDNMSICKILCNMNFVTLYHVKPSCNGLKCFSESLLNGGSADKPDNSISSGSKQNLNRTCFFKNEVDLNQSTLFRLTLEKINFNGTISPEFFSMVLTNIRVVRLSETKMTDAQWDNFSTKLKNPMCVLEGLWIDNSKKFETMLEHMRELSNLKILRISDNNNYKILRVVDWFRKEKICKQFLLTKYLHELNEEIVLDCSISDLVTNGGEFEKLKATIMKGGDAYTWCCEFFSAWKETII